VCQAKSIKRSRSQFYSARRKWLLPDMSSFSGPSSRQSNGQALECLALLEKCYFSVFSVFSKRCFSGKCTNFSASKHRLVTWFISWTLKYERPHESVILDLYTHGLERKETLLRSFSSFRKEKTLLETWKGKLNWRWAGKKSLKATRKVSVFCFSAVSAVFCCMPLWASPRAFLSKRVKKTEKSVSSARFQKTTVLGLSCRKATVLGLFSRRPLLP